MAIWRRRTRHLPDAANGITVRAHAQLGHPYADANRIRWGSACRGLARARARAGRWSEIHGAARRTAPGRQPVATRAAVALLGQAGGAIRERQRTRQAAAPPLPAPATARRDVKARRLTQHFQRNPPWLPKKRPPGGGPNSQSCDGGSVFPYIANGVRQAINKARYPTFLINRRFYDQLHLLVVC